MIDFDIDGTDDGADGEGINDGADGEGIDDGADEEETDFIDDFDFDDDLF